MSYSVQNIRNVCLLGHGGNGKTSLAESMLYLTGGTVRLGNPADGNTVCDYDPRGNPPSDFHLHRGGSRGVQRL